MHSIINKSDKCVGQYIYIRNNEYFVRIFTRFYNLCLNKDNSETKISENTVRDLLKMKKYNIESTVHIYDLNTGKIVLKPLKEGSVMIYMNKGNMLYIASEEELDKFLEDNDYRTCSSFTYIIGTQVDDYKFNNAVPIYASDFRAAKRIYKDKYNTEIEPIVIGVKDSGVLYVNTNNHILAVDVDEKSMMNEEV